MWLLHIDYEARVDQQSFVSHQNATEYDMRDNTQTKNETPKLYWGYWYF